MLGSVSALVLFAALLHATWNALLHGNRDRFLSITWMSLAVVPAALIAALFLPAPARAAWPYVVASGLVHIGYNASLVRAYRTGELGQAYPIARGSSPLLVALGAAIFAHERLTPIRILGVVLVSGGIISLTLARGRVSGAGTVAALSTGAIIAVYTVIDGAGARLSGNAASYAAWMFVFYAGTPILFVISRGFAALRASTRETTTSMAGGLVSIVAYGIVIWAMQFAPMGAISALRETSVLFAAFLGRIFLREKLTAARLVACLVIASGAVLLAR
ncbi:MAG TPA: DMT family transporter [Polyangiaceae bacterium]|nr:DMT family transporter [Polyangiaceae bacterium]